MANDLEVIGQIPELPLTRTFRPLQKPSHPESPASLHVQRGSKHITDKYSQQQSLSCKFRVRLGSGTKREQYPEATDSRSAPQRFFDIAICLGVGPQQHPHTASPCLLAPYCIWEGSVRSCSLDNSCTHRLPHSSLCNPLLVALLYAGFIGQLQSPCMCLSELP